MGLPKINIKLPQVRPVIKRPPPGITDGLPEGWDMTMMNAIESAGNPSPQPTQPEIKPAQPNTTPALTDKEIQESTNFIEKNGQQAIIDTLISKPITNISMADLQNARPTLEQIMHGTKVKQQEIQTPDQALQTLDEISAKLSEQKIQLNKDKQAQMKAAGLDTTKIDVQIHKDQVKRDVVDQAFPLPPISFVKDLSPAPTPQPIEEIKTPVLTAEAEKAKKAKENELTAEDVEQINELLGQATENFDKNQDIIGLFHTILAKTAAGREVMPALVQYMKEKGMNIPENIQPILDKLVQSAENTESSPLLKAALQSGLMTYDEAEKLNNPDQIGEVYDSVSNNLQSAIKNKDTASAQRFMRTLLKNDTFEFNYVGVMDKAGVLPSKLNVAEKQEKAKKYQETWEDMQNKTIRERLAKTFAKAGPGLGNSFMFMMILGQLTKMTQEISSPPEQGSGH